MPTSWISVMSMSLRRVRMTRRIARASTRACSFVPATGAAVVVVAAGDVVVVLPGVVLVVVVDVLDGVVVVLDGDVVDVGGTVVVVGAEHVAGPLGSGGDPLLMFQRTTSGWPAVYCTTYC